MTTITLNAILTAINALEPHAVPLASGGAPSATGGSSTTLVDTTNLKEGYRGSIYAGGWLTLTAREGANRHRRIDSDAPSSGTLTWTTATSTNVTTADTYLLWTTFDPRQVEAAVNRALERMRYVEQVDIAGVASQRQYALATDFAWLTSPEDVLGVSLRAGDTSGRYTWAPLPDDCWAVTEDRGVYTLQLPGPTYTSADSLRVEAWRPFAAFGTYLGADGYLTTGAGTTTAPANWLIAQSVAELLETMTRAEWGPEAGLLEKRLADARAVARLWQQRQKSRRQRPLFAGAGGTWHAAQDGVA